MTADLALVWPELILTIGGLITLMLGAFAGDRQVGLYQLAALLTLAAAAVAVAALFGTEASVFSGTLAVDGFGGFAKLLIYAASFVCIAIAPRYFGEAMRAEYSALIVFAAVVTPRMSVDTFPELTPPVLVIGTSAPGLGPKDVEKTITWRLEKYVGATPGVDHVQSVSRSGLSIIYVWLKWGTDLDSAQTLVQQQVAFAMAAIPKSLGVLPPFVLQYDPSNAPVVQVAVYGGGLSGPQLYDYAFNHIEPRLEGMHAS